MTNTPPESRPNPFSTRHVRPGAIPYQFPPGHDEERLLTRLAENEWRGQIVGPHGSGKSALIATLVPLVHEAGWRTEIFELHDGQRRLQARQWATAKASQHTLLFVDGYEQLFTWSRWRLGAICRSRKLGLVVTTHTSVGLPDLYRTAASLELAGQLVDQLLGSQAFRVTPEEIADRFAQHQGNLRETLFGLYDLYEARRPKQ